jgi:hypothetical protein
MEGLISTFMDWSGVYQVLWVVGCHVGGGVSLGVMGNYNEKSQRDKTLSFGTMVVGFTLSFMFWFVFIPRWLMTSVIKDGQKLDKLPRDFEDLQGKMRGWFNPTGCPVEDREIRNKKINKFIYVSSAVIWTFMVLIKLSLFM